VRSLDPMNTNCSVSFQIDELVGYEPVVHSVTPVINGTPLTELVTSFETVQQFEPLGGYGGLIPEFFKYGPLDSYLMGGFDPGGYWDQLGGIYVLGCDCGEVGCWPLICRLKRDGNVVVWDRFRNPFRPERDYSRFGPFVFDATLYRNAARDLQVRFTMR